jgi:hypothetical protein
MNKQPVDYIIEYYESIKDQYPHLTFTDIERVCRNNFRLIKSEMKKGSLRTIRLRYLGTFIVFKGRALGMLNKTRKMHQSGKVDEKTLVYIENIVKEYLKREYNETIPCSKIPER